MDFVENEAINHKFDGVAVWEMDWDWNPVSFYLHKGFSIADRIDKAVVAWKPFNDKAIKPKLARVPKIYFKLKYSNKVQVVLADNDWCNGRNRLEKALKGIEDIVEIHIVNDHSPGGYIHLGYAGGIFLDGEPYHPFEHLGGSTELNKYIIEKYENKNCSNH